MVTSEACSRATWASSTIVILWRNRRCTRVLTVLRNHVPVGYAPSPMAAASTRRGRCSMTPFPSSMSQSAMNASGSAETCDRTNAHSINFGSWRYPSLHSRHTDDSVGGSSDEGFIRLPFLVFRRGEALRLKIEHRPIAPAFRHQFVVRAQFDDAAL